MPTYQYACRECGHRFEAVQAFSDEALTECPVCAGPLRKVFSSVGVVFKGSGFYRNDSRTGSSSGGTGGASGSSSAASSDSGSSTSSSDASSTTTSSGTTSSGSASSASGASGSSGKSAGAA